MTSRTPVLTAACALVLALGAAPMHAATVISTSALSDSITVGLNDTNPAVAPAAPGDGWFTGAYEGTVRQRENNSSTQLRTQWYVRFDLSALAGVNPGSIVGATLDIPQIGRLNTLTTINRLLVFDTNASWDDDGGNYPTWNLGREAPTGSPGGTLLRDFGASSYQMFGTAADTSNPNVEGVFTVDNAALLATVQSWFANPNNNEGLLVTMTEAAFGGLAFGTPTLSINVTPAPAALPAGLALMGVLGLRRRRRAHA